MKYACVVVLGFSLSLFAQSVDYKPSSGSPLKFPNGVHSFVVGDVNEDRKPDLLVSSGKNLTVLLGNGRGGFEPLTNTSITLPHPVSEVITADVNRDGHLDWAAAFHETYDVIVMLGKGNGRFSPAPGSPFVTRAPGKRPHTHALASGDVNRDGKLDLITANSEDGDISVLFGDGKGGFTLAHGSPFPCGPAPYPVALADVNADSNLDIVVPNTAPGPTTITVLLGDGRGEFRAAPHSPFKANDRAYFVAVADLNGDNKPDIVATHEMRALPRFTLATARETLCRRTIRRWNWATAAGALCPWMQIATAKSISPLARNTASPYFSATVAVVFNARPDLPFALGAAPGASKSLM